MTPTREQVLSEFIDAWNAGRRPDVDDYVARVAADEQAALVEELADFLALAPTPSYSDDALRQIRAEIAEATDEQRPLLGALLARLRERFGLSTADLAGELAAELELSERQVPKTASYLEQLETGALEPTRVSRRVFDALGKLFRLPGSEFEGAADLGGWSRPAAAGAVFRADEDADIRMGSRLEALADALAAPGEADRDEVDDLFMGGR